VDMHSVTGGQILAAQVRDFCADEAASSTVEMVVGMAGAIGLGLAVMDAVEKGVENLSTDISSFLSNYEIRTSFDDPPAEEEAR